MTDSATMLSQNDPYVSNPIPTDVANEEPSELEQALRELLEVILLTLIFFFTLRSVLINFRISGSSMLPTLHDGEYVFVYRLAYWREPPERGDIIVFRYPLNPKRTLVKRVIALPGETVSVHNGQVYINGQPLPEPYILASPTYTAPPVTVGFDEVYVLGDNRNNSNDSHAWGLLKQDLIVGKALWRFWPLNRIGPVPHATYPPPFDQSLAGGGNP